MSHGTEQSLEQPDESIAKPAHCWRRVCCPKGESDTPVADQALDDITVDLEPRPRAAIQIPCIDRMAQLKSYLSQLELANLHCGWDQREAVDQLTSAFEGEALAVLDQPIGKCQNADCGAAGEILSTTVNGSSTRPTVDSFAMKDSALINVRPHCLSQGKRHWRKSNKAACCVPSPCGFGYCGQPSMQLCTGRSNLGLKPLLLWVCSVSARWVSVCVYFASGHAVSASCRS